MTRLAAVFAGGRSRRFGSDKALADIDGAALLDRVIERLRPQADGLIIVGRDWRDCERVEDRPRAGLGPLGALAGALAHAARNGFDEVLTSGCDLPDIPADLAVRLGAAPAIVAGQPLLGLWPSHLATRLIEHLDRTEDFSMRTWVAASGARIVALPRPVTNVNTQEDLAAFVRLSADPRSSP